MALENANSIPFELKQRQFLNYEAVVLKSSERMHILLFEINTAAIFQRIFWHLDSFPIEYHSIIKISDSTQALSRKKTNLFAAGE